MARPRGEIDSVYIYGYAQENPEALLVTLELFGAARSLRIAQDRIQTQLNESGDPDVGAYVIEEARLGGSHGPRWIYRTGEKGWQKYE